MKMETLIENVLCGACLLLTLGLTLVWVMWSENFADSLKLSARQLLSVLKEGE